MWVHSARKVGLFYMKTKEKSSVVRRTRNFATIVYPESAPEGWQSLLSDQFVPAFVSPLHDHDINPDGERKKQHYHVLIMFDGVKTTEQAKEIFDLIGGVGCEIVQSLRGYARYLCHLDNPEKFQYNQEEVCSYCGADYLSCIGLPTDKYKAIKEMMDYCLSNQIESYSDLLEYASESHYDWFRVLCDSGTMVIKEYLKSRTYTNRVKGLTEKRISECVEILVSERLREL